MQSTRNTEVHPTTTSRWAERIQAVVRGPWQRPLAKTGMALGAVVFLSWFGARSAASTPPPAGVHDPEISAMVVSAAEPVAAAGAQEGAATKTESMAPSSEKLQAQASPGPASPPSDKAQESDAGKDARPVGVLPDGRVVLNTATSEELCRLPGIGPSRAEKILALRARLGGFKSPRQLLRVKGIGPRTLKRLTPLFVLDAPPAPADPKPDQSG